MYISQPRTRIKHNTKANEEQCDVRGREGYAVNLLGTNDFHFLLFSIFLLLSSSSAFRAPCFSPSILLCFVVSPPQYALPHVVPCCSPLSQNIFPYWLRLVSLCSVYLSHSFLSQSFFPPLISPLPSLPVFLNLPWCSSFSQLVFTVIPYSPSQASPRLLVSSSSLQPLRMPVPHNAHSKMKGMMVHHCIAGPPPTRALAMATAINAL